MAQPAGFAAKTPANLGVATELDFNSFIDGFDGKSKAEVVEFLRNCQKLVNELKETNQNLASRIHQPSKLTRRDIWFPDKTLPPDAGWDRDY